MNAILVYVNATRPEDGEVAAALVGAAADAGTAHVLFTGACAREAALQVPGAASVRWCDESDVAAADGRAAATLLAGIADREQVHIVLAPQRPHERDVAARVAVRLARPLVRRAVAIGPDAVTVRTPAGEHHGVGTAAPLVLTMLPGYGVALDAAAPSAEQLTAEPGTWPATGQASAARERPAAPLAAPLGAADVIVTGGRGLQEAGGFELVHELAGRLRNAAVGATAPVVNDGWAPSASLVGKTGRMVQPSVYFTVGVSGAFFHESAAREVDYLVAVNRDATANSVLRANAALVGDALEVLPRLVAALGEGEPAGD